MHRIGNRLTRGRVSVFIRALPALAAVGTAGLLAGCGGSGADPKTLLRESFSGVHAVNSGILAATLKLTPVGSSVLEKPITVSFGGPFQSRGKNKLPASRFSASIGFEGHTGTLTFLSTGTAGYVQMAGTSYSLPAANFKQLESGFSSVTGSSGGSSSGMFSKLGIHPQDWVMKPRVVGSEQVGGTDTQHVRGRIALPRLLADLSTLLGKAPAGVSAAAGTSVPKSIPPATRAKIEREVHNATFDLWTGSSDHTIRRLTVSATMPISGTATRSQLGGLSALGISFTLGYSDVGRHETITAPSKPKPYSQFESQINQTVQAIEELVLASATQTGSSGTGTTGAAGGLAGTSTTGSAGGLAGAGAGSGNSAYDQCATKAGADIAKLQKCASLLNG